MWLSSLRRLLAGKTPSRNTKPTRTPRRRVLLTLDRLEDRIVPSNFTFNVDAGDINGTPPAGDYNLIGAINQANADSGTGNTETINLTNGTYKFSSTNNSTNGANLLPLITATNLTIQGNGSTLNGASLGRFFDVTTGAGLTLDNLTLTGGEASGANAQGGAIYNNGGNVTLNTVIAGGNQALGGTGQNAQGGAIYSNAGNVTLSKDIIGAKETKFHNSSGFTTKFTIIGSANQVHGGVGASVQGGGLYVSGGVVKVTNGSIAGNVVSAAAGGSGASGGTAQGGGIYSTGANLTISGASVSSDGVYGGKGGTGIAGTSKHVTGGAGGAGGIGQGGGIYAKGGSLTLTNGATVNNENLNSGNAGTGGKGYNANGAYGAGGSGGVGGNADGGGVFASNTIVVESNSDVNFSVIHGGYGGIGGLAGQGKMAGQGGAGSQSFGGGLYIDGGSITIAGGSEVVDNAIFGGGGGYGGGGSSTAANPSGMIGGAGGAGGALAGGGIYVVSAPLTLTSGTVDPGKTILPGINENSIMGGRGGNGGAGGKGGAGRNGGNGAIAQGGDVFASGTQVVTLGNVGNPVPVSVNGGSAAGGDGGSAGHGGIGAANGVGGAGGLGTGGGLTIYGDKVSIDNSTIFNNNVYGGQGGVGAVSAGSKVISNYGAGGDAQGAGLFISGSSSVTILNSSIYKNTLVAGDGRATLTAVGSAKYGLGGTSQGGGLYLASSNVNIINSTFADNTNTLGGDSATSKTTGVKHITGGGAGQGGGVYATNGTLTLLNDTVAWNYIYQYQNFGGTGNGAGVYNATSNTLHLENTIIALNQLVVNPVTGQQFSQGQIDTLTPNDLYGNAASSNHDLIGDGTGSNLVNGTNGDQVGTDAAPINPNFAPPFQNSLYGELDFQGQAPGNYGGLTFTMPLASNSPALNAGDATAAATIAAAEGVSTANATDQRGLARVINGEIDIGATQSGLLLSGTAPATVQAGQNITYTLTLSNNGPSTLTNVTLTDAVPTNTTFVSLTAPSGWTTSAPAVGATGTIAATLATLAADTTATFTIVVQVNSGTAGGTVIANTPNVTYTGTANPVVSKLTLNTTVPGPSTTDITNEVGMFETPIFYDPFAAPGTFLQLALFINESGTALTGPIAIVFNGLPPGVTVENASGTINGSPYINIEPPNGVWLPGVRYFLLDLIVFSDPSFESFSYTPEILQGI